MFAGEREHSGSVPAGAAASGARWCPLRTVQSDAATARLPSEATANGKLPTLKAYTNPARPEGCCFSPSRSLGCPGSAALHAGGLLERLTFASAPATVR